MSCELRAASFEREKALTAESAEESLRAQRKPVLLTVGMLRTKSFTAKGAKGSLRMQSKSTGTMA
jgi:hypothetical protein